MKIPQAALRRVQLWAEKYIISRRPDFYIGGQEDAYLERWWIIPRNKWFNIYLHRILKSDRDEALHDHPWINMSLLIMGAYDEVTIAEGGVQYVSPLYAGELRFRRPTAAHRLVVKEGDGRKEVWTLFVTGPVWRHWGFHCSDGWRHWHDFIGFRSEHENIVGRGCGEMDYPRTPGGRIPLFYRLLPSSGKRS